MNLLNNPLGGGLIGSWYERWATECLEQQTDILISNDQLSLERPEGEMQKGNSMADQRSGGLLKGTAESVRTFSRFRFKALKHVEISIPKNGSEPQVPVDLEPGVLYKPRSKINPSIDAFGVTKVGENIGDLILIQFTKALSHSSARWSHLTQILRAARALYRGIRVILVYCCPHVQPFTIPRCETLDGSGVLICKGALDKDFYLELKSPQRIGAFQAAAHSPDWAERGSVLASEAASTQ